MTEPNVEDRKPTVRTGLENYLFRQIALTKNLVSRKEKGRAVKCDRSTIDDKADIRLGT